MVTLAPKCWNDGLPSSLLCSLYALRMNSFAHCRDLVNSIICALDDSQWAPLTCSLVHKLCSIPSLGPWIRGGCMVLAIGFSVDPKEESWKSKLIVSNNIVINCVVNFFLSLVQNKRHPSTLQVKFVCFLPFRFLLSGIESLQFQDSQFLALDLLFCGWLTGWWMNESWTTIFGLKCIQFPCEPSLCDWWKTEMIFQ